jgi:phage terminase small subunit
MKSMPIQTKPDTVNAQETTQPAAPAPAPTKEDVLGELMRLGFSNMLDYIVVKDGNAHVDLTRLTRDQAAAIVEVTTSTRTTKGRGEDGEGATTTVDVRFKLADKRQALVEIGRHLGLFSEPAAPEPETPDFNDPKARQELARRMMFALDEAKEPAKN